MSDNPLGRTVAAPSTHDSSVLYAMPRHIPGKPMHGMDLWRCYELSWLDPGKKPSAAVLEIAYPRESRNIVESKSLKLYLSGISNTSFSGPEEVRRIITRDLQKILHTPWMAVEIHEKENPGWNDKLPGACIDGIETVIPNGKPDATAIEVRDDTASESLHSHILRTYCPITHQPDWSSVLIEYQGKRIDRASLLRYLCSYRGQEGFSEDICERIYLDLLERCSPKRLEVSCFYTRRGGIDINPVRSLLPMDKGNRTRFRLFRQ